MPCTIACLKLVTVPLRFSSRIIRACSPLMTHDVDDAILLLQGEPSPRRLRINQLLPFYASRGFTLGHVPHLVWFWVPDGLYESYEGSVATESQVKVKAS